MNNTIFCISEGWRWHMYFKKEDHTKGRHAPWSQFKCIHCCLFLLFRGFVRKLNLFEIKIILCIVPLSCPLSGLCLYPFTPPSWAPACSLITLYSMMRKIKKYFTCSLTGHPQNSTHKGQYRL